MRSTPGIDFDLTGGALCLDFANTVSDRSVPDRRHDLLVDYAALIAWGRQTNLISRTEAASLLRHGAVAPREAENLLASAVALREAVYRVFSALAAGRPVPPTDLETLGERAIDALRHRRLEATRGGVRWRWDDEGSALQRVLWRVAQSAADLLTSEHARSVRECAAPTCAWLFVDESRNHTRRWCDMKVCGNREKARRFHQRARALPRPRSLHGT